MYTAAGVQAAQLVHRDRVTGVELHAVSFMTVQLQVRMDLMSAPVAYSIGPQRVLTGVELRAVGFFKTLPKARMDNTCVGAVGDLFNERRMTYIQPGMEIAFVVRNQRTVCSVCAI